MFVVTLSYMAESGEKEWSPWVLLQSAAEIGTGDGSACNHSLRRAKKSVRGRAGTSPWPTSSLLSPPQPRWASSWDRKPLVHMATSQFMWELIASLPVSEKLWKSHGAQVQSTLSATPSAHASPAHRVEMKTLWQEHIFSPLFSLYLMKQPCAFLWLEKGGISKQNTFL